jgi:hypothetical protein
MQRGERLLLRLEKKGIVEMRNGCEESDKIFLEGRDEGSGIKARESGRDQWRHLRGRAGRSRAAGIRMTPDLE